MKLIILIVSGFLLTIFSLSIRNSVNSFKNMTPYSFVEDSVIYAFDPEFNKNSGLNELESEISRLIVSHKITINKCDVWSIALNLLITIVTGLAALIATISTIKNNSVTKSVAILVAVITFISSLLSYSLGQVNTFKEGAKNKRQRIIKIREKLESLKPNEVNLQLPVLKRRLDEEL